MTINFNEKLSSIIKVIGIGGGGCNAVEYMYDKGICDVDFAICNTDNLASNTSTITNKIQLGNKINGGLGAGNNPAEGEKLAKESLADIEPY